MNSSFRKGCYSNCDCCDGFIDFCICTKEKDKLDTRPFCKCQYIEDEVGGGGGKQYLDCETVSTLISSSCAVESQNLIHKKKGKPSFLEFVIDSANKSFLSSCMCCDGDVYNCLCSNDDGMPRCLVCYKEEMASACTCCKGYLFNCNCILGEVESNVCYCKSAMTPTATVGDSSSGLRGSHLAPPVKPPRRQGSYHNPNSDPNLDPIFNPNQNSKSMSNSSVYISLNPQASESRMCTLCHKRTNGLNAENCDFEFVIDSANKSFLSGCMCCDGDVYNCLCSNDDGMPRCLVCYKEEMASACTCCKGYLFNCNCILGDDV